MTATEYEMAPQTPLVAKLSREDVAKLEIGHTDISPTLSWCLTLIFLVTIFSVPLVQHARELRGQNVQSASFEWPQCYDIFKVAADAVTEFRVTEGNFIDRIVAANALALAGIQRDERELEDQSIVGQRLLPLTQWVLTGYSGAGNEEAYVGRDGWLFYRPDVEFVAGQPFLDSARLKRRVQKSASAEPVQPDPRRAIHQFQQQLSYRNIRLVVVPIPAKPTIHPERFSPRLSADDAPLANASYQELIDDLRGQGVLVFDPTQAILDARRPDEPAYLATDTHWTPAAAEAMARRWPAGSNIASFSPTFRPLRSSATASQWVNWATLPPCCDCRHGKLYFTSKPYH